MKQIFTIGHSTRTIEDFLAILEAHEVELLVDIRTVPRSRHNPQFNRENLPESLAGVRIGYVHCAELGGLRRARVDSQNAAWRNLSFRGYADYMQTPEFEKGLESIIQAAETRNLALMCAEAVPWRCHRSLVADALVARGIPVLEIFSARPAAPHKLTPFARVAGGSVTYPPGPAIARIG